MRTSDILEQISPALIEARAEIQNPHKTEKGYGYRYAPLDGIIDQVTPILLQRGVLQLQSLTRGTDDRLAVTTRLQHQSGEYIEDTFCPADAHLEGQAGKNPVQQQGAAITYARRYALCAMLGISADSDTDGTSPRGKQPVPAAHPTGPTLCPIGGPGWIGKPWDEFDTDTLRTALNHTDPKLTQQHKDEISRVLETRK